MKLSQINLKEVMELWKAFNMAVGQAMEGDEFASTEYLFIKFLESLASSE